MLDELNKLEQIIRKYRRYDNMLFAASVVYCLCFAGIMLNILN